MTELPTGTVTFLFTDVEGSTRLLKQLGEGYGAVIAAHQVILRDAFAGWGGQEIDTQGDSFFVAFSRAKDAVAAAVEGQRALVAHPWPSGGELRVRIGVHTGEPVVGPERYVGLGVHRAARIMAAGHGGQILLSSATRELIEDDLAADISLRDLGEYRLKDLDRPEHLFQVVVEGLADQFPPLRTEDAPTAYTGLEDELAEAARTAVARPPPLRRRSLLVAVAAGVIAAAVAIPVFALAERNSGSGRPLRVGPNSAAAIDGGTGRIIASVPVGSGPVRAAAGEGALWVANGDAGTVSRIDPVKQAVVQTVDVGSGPAGIAVGAGDVWVTNGVGGTLSRINAGTNRVVQTTPLPSGPRGVAYGEGAVWVANLDDRSVSRVDSATGRVVRTIATGGTPTAIAAGLGSVWVTNEAGSSVTRIDPRTGTVVGTINVGNGPSAIAVGLGAVWVANTLDATVSRIDPSTGTVTGTVPVGQGPDDVAVGLGSVWVANEFAGTISQIDPRTNTVIASPATGDRPTGVVVDGAVWVTVRPAGGAHRGGTFTFAVASNAIDSLDSAIAYGSGDWQILSLTGDGLTAFRRVGGQDGGLVVPDLATALPTPTDGGKTYTFQLRPGIRYSTGALVGPKDIRTAIERVFELGSPGAAYYGGIAGSSACAKGKRCDLSRGIVVDAAAGTIVFHLTAPEPELPQKLALPFAFAVPANTPCRVARRPLPATGPYVIARYDGRRRLELVRNPHFHVWSAAARPGGYPDAIVMRIGETDDNATTAVERGRLDYVANVPHDRIDEVATRYAAQLHSSPYPQTSYLLMNTRLAPFDRLDARRAVAYAVNRGAIVGLVGGRRFAQPTCQILPPNFPGYQRYCPYTAHPSKKGIWRAPDVSRARELIARSGTRGAPVTVLSPQDQSFLSEARYVVRLLAGLGYKTSLKILPFDAFFARITKLSGGVQIAVVVWVADYPSAGAFIRPTQGCGSKSNYTGFCDRRIDAEMRRAEILQRTDPRAANSLWAHIDRELVDAAPWVPVMAGESTDFVSRRVGNFQLHPVCGLLFDQLWVR